MSSHKFGCILEHMDKTVQFTQNRVWDMPRRSGFAVKKDRDIRVFEADFADKFPEILQRGLHRIVCRELFVIDRQNKSGSAALLLSKLR